MTIVPRGGKHRAQTEVTTYKRACLVAGCWHGIGVAANIVPGEIENLPRRQLASEARQYRAIFKKLLEPIIGRPPTNTLESRAADWFSSQYEVVVGATGPVSLGNLLEFESHVAPTLMGALVDAPPYTELLMQGTRGLAYRHPEYMLAREVEFNYNIFWQAEELVVAHAFSPSPPMWVATAAENVQGLARATILSCFSLLESTVSGLGRAHDMLNPGLTTSERKKLVNNHGPLLDRLLGPSARFV